MADVDEKTVQLVKNELDDIKELITDKIVMERIRKEWAEFGLELPKIVYWNVCARNNVILDGGQDVSFVSGASPVLFEQICKGVTGMELMLDKLKYINFQMLKKETF